MKQRILLIIMLLPLCTCLRAEIAADIIEVLSKSDSVISRPEGVKMEMDVKASIAILSMNLQITSLEKGNKSRMIMQTTVLGKTFYSEEGCDGTQGWSYEKNDLSKSKDTLTIYPAESLDNDYTVEMDAYKDYENAKMKLKDEVYEIVLSKPKSEDVPKKTTMRIDAKTFYPKQMQIKDSGATITINIKEISFGVDDKELAFDIANYPDAVIHSVQNQ